MDDPTSEVGRLQLRRERAAVLQDRCKKSTSEPGDLTEALALLAEAHDDLLSLQQAYEEAGQWKTLVQSNVDVMSRVEPLIRRATRRDEAWAAVLKTMSNPKVLLTIIFCVVLVIGALIGQPDILKNLPGVPP